jgi:ATP-binding cassette, subfamily B, bacterial PglK
MISIAFRALSLFSAAARLQTAGLFGLIVAMALLEMLSIGLVIPLIQVLFADTGAGKFSAQIQAFLPEGDDIQTAIAVAAVFCGAFVLKNILILALTYLINWTVMRKAAEAQGRLFNVYLDKPFAFHVRTNSAEILRNIMSGCGQSFEACRQVFMIGLEIILSMATVVLLLVVEPLMTLIIGAFLIPGAVAFYFATGGCFRAWGQKSMDIEEHEIRWINQALGSIRFAKIFGATQSLTQKLFDLARARAVFDSRAATALHMPRLFLETLVIIGVMVTIGVAISSGQQASELTATLGVFVLAALRLLPSLNRILAGTAELRRRSPYIDTIYDDLMTDPHAGKRVAGGSVSAEPTARFDFQEQIVLQDVSLTYVGADVPALRNTNLTIRRGESIGIVGPSGAGKSSLVDTIIGLLVPDTGNIIVDGKDITDRMQGWQALIGYVPQETYLLDDTLRRNIAFSVGDGPIAQDRVRAALEMAKLADVVDGLPDGLDTILGERGARLSGGQRQRIAIARALYRDPEVLVFDEATAALDNEAESEVSAAIRALFGDKTILIIAHRLSTVRHCDRIVYMKEGQIQDSGAFTELYERCEAFRHLVDLGESRITDTVDQPE